MNNNIDRYSQIKQTFNAWNSNDKSAFLFVNKIKGKESLATHKKTTFCGKLWMKIKSWFGCGSFKKVMQFIVNNKAEFKKLVNEDSTINFEKLKTRVIHYSANHSCWIKNLDKEVIKILTKDITPEPVTGTQDKIVIIEPRPEINLDQNKNDVPPKVEETPQPNVVDETPQPNEVEEESEVNEAEKTPKTDEAEETPQSNEANEAEEEAPQPNELEEEASQPNELEEETPLLEEAPQPNELEEEASQPNELEEETPLLEEPPQPNELEEETPQANDAEKEQEEAPQPNAVEESPQSNDEVEILRPIKGPPPIIVTGNKRAATMQDSLFNAAKFCLATDELKNGKEIDGIMKESEKIMSSKNAELRFIRSKHGKLNSLALGKLILKHFNDQNIKLHNKLFYRWISSPQLVQQSIYKFWDDNNTNAAFMCINERAFGLRKKVDNKGTKVIEIFDPRGSNDSKKAVSLTFARVDDAIIFLKEGKCRNPKLHPQYKLTEKDWLKKLKINNKFETEAVLKLKAKERVAKFRSLYNTQCYIYMFKKIDSN